MVEHEKGSLPEEETSKYLVYKLLAFRVKQRVTSRRKHFQVHEVTQMARQGLQSSNSQLWSDTMLYPYSVVSIQIRNHYLVRIKPPGGLMVNFLK